MAKMVSCLEILSNEEQLLKKLEKKYKILRGDGNKFQIFEGLACKSQTKFFCC